MKLQMKCAAAGIAAVILFAAPAAFAETPIKPSKDDRSCFFANQVTGWNRIDDKTIRVTISSKRQYDFTLMSPVAGGLFQETIAIKSHPSSVICTGNGLGVSVVTGDRFVGPSSYPVTKIAAAPIVRKNPGKPAIPLEGAAPETVN